MHVIFIILNPWFLKAIVAGYKTNCSHNRPLYSMDGLTKLPFCSAPHCLQKQFSFQQKSLFCRINLFLSSHFLFRLVQTTSLVFREQDFLFGGFILCFNSVKSFFFNLLFLSFQKSKQTIKIAIGQDYCRYSVGSYCVFYDGTVIQTTLRCRTKYNQFSLIMHHSANQTPR